MSDRAFDPADFPLFERGHLYEDFEIGQQFDHHWGRTITDADNALFSTALCWFHPLYLNAMYAVAQGHPTMVVNPMLVLCTAVGMSVEDLSEAGGPFLGVDDCVVDRPVYPGDTITAHSVVEHKRESATRPEGIVTWQTIVVNQHGERVMTYRRTNLVTRRVRDE